LAIILVFKTSNGFPAVDPIVPAIAPAMNFYAKPAPGLSAPVHPLAGSYRPILNEVYDASLIQAAPIPL